MPDDAFLRSVTSKPPDLAVKQTKLQLRLLATSDIHVALSPFDYFKDCEDETGSLSRTAKLIAKARKEVGNTLLFDNGDFLNGGPLGDYIQSFRSQPNPVIEVMNRLRYDAVNLGNHEFSSGIDFLKDALNGAEFPVVSANTFTTDTGAHFVSPWVVLDRILADPSGDLHTVRIGVVGALPPQTAVWDQQAIDGRVVISDMRSAIIWGVDAVKRAGADIVVVLAHCGIGEPDAPAMSEDAGLSISGINGIDALILGHAHLQFPDPTIAPSQHVDPVAGRLCDIPTVMPGAFGSHLGVIDLDLCRDQHGWRVTQSAASLRATSKRTASGKLRSLVRPDRTVVNQIASVHDAARKWVGRPVAHSTKAFHSFFSMITDVPAIQLVHLAQIDYVQRKLETTAWAGIPVISATAPFKAGGRGGPDYFTYVPAGDVLLRHLSDLYLYPNTLCAFAMRGEQLRTWLELSASAFRTITPGLQDQGLLNPDRAPFQYDSLGGLTYEIDLSAPPGVPGTSHQRVRNLKYNGSCVQDDQTFILAVNSYRASGSGGYLDPSQKRVDIGEDRLCRDILEDYLFAHGDRVLDEKPFWRFAPMSGTSVILETSPAALACLNDVRHLDLTPLGISPQGFLQLRLNL